MYYAEKPILFVLAVKFMCSKKLWKSGIKSAFKLPKNLDET